MPSPGSVLGLDLGDVRIGVAVSDPDRRVAVPIGTVQVGRPPGELKAIATLVVEHDVVLIVLGDPVSMDGSRGSRSALATGFAEALRAFVSVPVVLQDERLSTVQADRSLRDAGVRGRDRRASIDATAAQVILQAWLEAQPGYGGAAPG